MQIHSSEDLGAIVPKFICILDTVSIKILGGSV